MRTIGIWMGRASFGKLFQRNRCLYHLNKANSAEEESEQNNSAREFFC